MKDRYRDEVIDPGDRVSKLAHAVNVWSYANNPAVTVVAHTPGNFRGPVGFVWKPHILRQMLRGSSANRWVMLEEVENDGAGGKPQFFTLAATPRAFGRLGWEIITMTADDFARSGRFPAVIVNELNTKRITRANLPLIEATLRGYGRALKKARLASLTGETAVMKHSITAFCDDDSDEQLVLTWGAACIGLAHRKLLIDGSKIRPGMPIVGFWEPGYRCNGGTFFTNLLLDVCGSVRAIRRNVEAMRFVQQLTVPSQSYARTVCRLLGWYRDGSLGRPMARIAGIAHITGGGIWGKFGELLPEGVGAELSSMPAPAPVLLAAQRLSRKTDEPLTDWKAHSTLHGGCGMLLVCETHEDAVCVATEARHDGIRAKIVGRTTQSAQRLITIQSSFLEGKLLRSNEPS